MRTAAVALLLVLAACSGGSGGSGGTSTPTAPPSVGVSAAPTVAPPTGVPVPEALSRFRCEPDAKGVWNASGYLTNSGKAKVTFQVTVYVGPAAGAVERARTRQIPDVAGGGSVRFTLSQVPVGTTGGACHVQVVAAK